MTSHFIASLYGQFFSSATIAETAGGAMTIHSACGRYIMWVIAFLIVCPLTLWCWRRRIGGHYAPGFFFASFTIPILVVPGIAMEFVQVAPNAIDIRTGLWFAPTDHHIPLTNLDSIVETDEKWDTFWEFRYRSGPSGRIDLPDLFDANRSHVIQYLRAHGFKVRNA